MFCQGILTLHRYYMHLHFAVGVCLAFEIAFAHEVCVCVCVCVHTYARPKAINNCSSEMNNQLNKLCCFSVYSYTMTLALDTVDDKAHCELVFYCQRSSSFQSKKCFISCTILKRWSVSVIKVSE